MLSLLIIFLIFGTVLPVLHGMQANLQLKKERSAAFETMYEGAKEVKAVQHTNGVRIVNGVRYEWELSDRICVVYRNYREKTETVCSS